MKKDHCTSNQRYYEFLDCFQAPDGPIFLKICGESLCNGIQKDYALAKKFGASVVSLEHRYYGKSSPFKSLATENLRFLSSKQALFDLAAFRQFHQASLVYISLNLKPNKASAETHGLCLVSPTLELSVHGALEVSSFDMWEPDKFSCQLMSFMTFRNLINRSVSQLVQNVKLHYKKLLSRTKTCDKPECR
ncbi:putative serine protease EDA2 [Drosera capensis]